MRHTIMLNLDEAHAIQLDELREHFHLAAEDTLRLAIRLTHARHKQKPDVLVPEFKPRAAKDWWRDDDDNSMHPQTAPAMPRSHGLMVPRAFVLALPRASY